MTLSPLRRLTVSTLIVAFTVSLSGCGTLFYPERKGQLPGRIDPGVAIVDGVGLLLFVIPGLIAYAIDFSNNTIYLPGTHGASIEPVTYPGKLDDARLARLIETRTGTPVDWHAEVVRVESSGDLDATLASVISANRRIADS